jgi:hypothetical protein
MKLRRQLGNLLLKIRKSITKILSRDSAMAQPRPGQIPCCRGVGFEGGGRGRRGSRASPIVRSVMQQGSNQLQIRSKEYFLESLFFILLLLLLHFSSIFLTVQYSLLL